VIGLDCVTPLNAPQTSVGDVQGTQLLLPRYERPRELADENHSDPDITLIPFEASTEAIAASALSPGSKAMARALLRLGRTRTFGGGGAGIEYGSLLKTAARPDLLGSHVAEAARHLQDQDVDLMLVPGMSGYPIGAMYSFASDIPAILLKKVKYWADAPVVYPPGAFVIPSYTGDGDVVMHADQDALQDIVDTVATAQLAEQAEADAPTISLRVAGADDIIDKATMSLAVSESALVVGRAAIEDFIVRHRTATGDSRAIGIDIRVVAWVTPLIKAYNGPIAFLERTIGIRPFVGLTVTSLHLSPPAIGIEGLGIMAFPG